MSFPLTLNKALRELGITLPESVLEQKLCLRRGRFVWMSLRHVQSKMVVGSLGQGGLVAGKGLQKRRWKDAGGKLFVSGSFRGSDSSRGMVFPRILFPSSPGLR